MTGQAKARGTYEQRKALAVARNAEIAERDAEARAIRMAKREASPEGRRWARRHQATALRVAAMAAATAVQPIRICTEEEIGKWYA